MCVDIFWSVNLECERSYLIVQKGFKIKIKKCSKIKTENCAKDCAQSRFKIVSQSRIKTGTLMQIWKPPYMFVFI